MLTLRRPMFPYGKLLYSTLQGVHHTRDSFDGPTLIYSIHFRIETATVAKGANGERTPKRELSSLENSSCKVDWVSSSVHANTEYCRKLRRSFLHHRWMRREILFYGTTSWKTKKTGSPAPFCLVGAGRLDQQIFSVLSSTYYFKNCQVGRRGLTFLGQLPRRVVT